LPSKPLPVIAPIGVGAGGESYNINADRAAAALAVGLKVDELIFLTDQAGIYDEEGEIIRHVDAVGLENLIDAKIVTGGMLAKTQAILHALNGAVPSVKVTNARNDTGTACLLRVWPEEKEGLRHVAI
jgi:acetylglutamate kinase